MFLFDHYHLPHLMVLLQCRRPGFSPWVGKIPWRRAWPATHSSILVLRIPHGQRSLVGYSPLSHTESDTTEQLSTHTHSQLLRSSIAENKERG